ncbi:hypothetical protein IG631_06549 [Alternaria alternata]|nr:hypothetical protein IG631_06549 [Alternaria alternata]
MSVASGVGMSRTLEDSEVRSSTREVVCFENRSSGIDRPMLPARHRNVCVYVQEF